MNEMNDKYTIEVLKESDLAQQIHNNVLSLFYSFLFSSHLSIRKKFRKCTTKLNLFEK